MIARMLLLAAVSLVFAACSRLFEDKDLLRHNFYQKGDDVVRYNFNRLEFKTKF